MIAITKHYPERLKTLKGFLVVPLAELPELRPGALCYVTRETRRRGAFYRLGEMRDRDGGRVKVWFVGRERSAWVEAQAVKVVIAT